MNKERFNHLLSHLNDVTNEDIKSLNELRKKYPFFQTPYVIVAKALQALEHPKTDAFIKKAAIYSPDRAHLKKIITGELTFDAPSEPKPKQEPETNEPPLEAKQPTIEKEETPKVEAAKDLVAEQKEIKEPKGDTSQKEVAPVEKIMTQTPVTVEKSQSPKPEPIDIIPVKLAKTDQISELERDLIEIRERKQRLAKMLNQQDEKVEEKKSTQKKTNKSQVELIEKFIQNEPQFEKKTGPSQDSEYQQEDLATKKLKYQDEFATETLAALLFKQKKYARALDIYEKLSLKFPEKRTYFALQIQKIKESQHV